MDQQQQSRWRPTRRQLLWSSGIAALAFLFILFCGYLFGWKWTGLPQRTLWDWLNLLIVPVVLAIGGFLFTRSENRATRDTVEQRTQDDTLQTYLDQIGQLLLDKERPLRKSKKGDEVRTLGRARTFTVLRRLDSERKGRVLQFLYEAGLIDKDPLVLDLMGADLSEAHVGNAYLDQAYLGGANLSKAYLSGAVLRGVNLSRADLSEANLSEAKLFDADLSKADLSGANLWYVNLSEANLWNVNLSGAALNRAKDISEERLKQAKSLKGATMPNGQKYEDWLKSKVRAEDGENE